MRTLNNSVRFKALNSVKLKNFSVGIGKNRPLAPERIKWNADHPMTHGQLRSKRDEFWETAPAFEGKVRLDETIVCFHCRNSKNMHSCLFCTFRVLACFRILII